MIADSVARPPGRPDAIPVCADGSMPMRARVIFSVLLAAVALATLGPAAFAARPPIMPLSQIHAGLDCIGETVVQGTTITSFNVHVIDVVKASGVARILVRVAGPAVDATGIAQGFSGSPVFCTDATGTPLNAGAISQGVGEYGNKVGLVTPIEQMLGEPVKPPSSAPRLSAATRPLLGPLTVSGVSPSLAPLLREAGRRAGRTVLVAPSGSALDFPLQPLVPGASVAVGYSRGAITLGGVGTVTYVDGANVYAFGHPFDNVGRRSLLLEDAYVYAVVSNPNTDFSTSYKLALPGHVEGTLTSDTPNAVVGQVGAPPKLIPVHVAARDLDTGHTVTEDTFVADETDVGLPIGSSLIGSVGPLAVAQAVIDIYDGAPANESGRMCLRVTIRESPQPLQLCNRYVGTGGSGFGPPFLASGAMGDVGTALGLVDQVRFAALHVTGVVASIDVHRGLAEATIVKATAPRRVKPGHAVKVSLLVRLYRGPLRTITLPLRIPASAHGVLTATLRGGGSGPSSGPTGPGAALQSLAAAFAGGPAGPPSAAPTSLAALRKAFTGVASYDGIQVSFGRQHKQSEAYRDPALLILGQATIRFMAAR
jgi:hypothetical protein